MIRTYAIADFRGRFDLLLLTMEMISSHARELRRGLLPEHQIAILEDISKSPEIFEIKEYLTIERSRRGAPVIVDDVSKYRFSTDLHPNCILVGIFEDESSDSPADFISIETP